MTLRVIRDPSIAEEVAQDVFLAMWAKAASFDATRGSARSWILTIAHRRAVDVVRREQASRDRLTRVAADDVHRPFDEVAELVLRRCEDREVRVALRALTPIQRQAVELAYYQGLTYRQVAQRLDVPLGTIKTRIRDGLRRLGANLAQAAPATAGASSTLGAARST